jgi:protein-S-isoprenylcysteine O-methyltransferase Ste14
LPGARGIAVGLFVVGVMISVLGVVSFRRAKTTVNPLQPAKASTLVATGIYRLSRNPMYLGFLVCLLGWAVLLSHPTAFLLLPLFVLGMNRWQIVPEEQALALRFGPEFAAYQARTRRWL